MTKSIDDLNTAIEKLISNFPYESDDDSQKQFITDTKLVSAVLEEEGEEFSMPTANLIYSLIQNARENELEARNPYRR
jgi:hypothetical protein